MIAAHEAQAIAHHRSSVHGRCAVVRTPVRTFNVNDDFNRESLKIEVDSSLPSGRVIRALNELVELRGVPRRLRLDNGLEFISAALKQWAQQQGVELMHIQPGKPTQNAYIERFNRTFRTEALDRYVFTTLGEVRRMAEDWCHRTTIIIVRTGHWAG